jgi:prephenate dehydrogenase
VKSLKDAQVAVVGLGLMGGSLTGALRRRCRTVVGVARRTETVETALARNLVDRGTTALADGVREADAVILATPVRVVLRLLAEIGPLLRDGCLLMDLGSTKSHIVARMAELPNHVQPLGGHPMCGKELSGIEAADSRLYRGATFVLTPLPRTSEAALALGRSLVEAIGARAVVLEPDRHDQLVAAVSHLPYLAACGLVGTVEWVASSDPMARKVAASGFRDTSRLAASDVTMMLDILLTNQHAVTETLKAYQAHLCNLAHLIQSGDEEGLRAVLTTSRQGRIGYDTGDTEARNVKRREEIS